MTTAKAILVGALIVGACIFLSGGIYEGVPITNGGYSFVVRLNKLTGEVSVCTEKDGCVPQKDYKFH